MARNTTCTTVSDVWDGFGVLGWSAGIVGAIGILTVGVWAALAAFHVASLTPTTMIIAANALWVAALIAIAALYQLRTYFFDHRLICQGDDRCAMAHVITVEDDGDGDKSLNTILAPATYDTSETDYRAMGQASELVYKNTVPPLETSRGWHLDPKANRPDLWPKGYGRDGQLPFFHCEIEGTKFDDWTTALIAYLFVLLALAIAAMVAAAAATALGPIAWAIWIAVALLILLLSLFFGSLGDEDTGSAGAGPIGDATPSPTGPVITDSGGNHISGGDYVALLGRPVCDAGHNPTCWDELHPLKAIAKIQQSEYEAVPAVPAIGGILDQYCDALHGFVDAVGKVQQRLAVTDAAGNPKLAYLEHPQVG